MEDRKEEQSSVVVVCSSESCGPKPVAAATAAEEQQQQSLPRRLINTVPLADEWRFCLPDVLSDDGARQCLTEMEKHGARRLSTLKRNIFHTPILSASDIDLWHQQKNAHLTIGPDAIHNLCRSIFQFVAGVQEYSQIRHLPRKLPVAMPWSATRNDFIKHKRLFTFKPDGERQLLFWTGHDLWSCGPDFVLKQRPLDGVYKKRLADIQCYFLLDGELLHPKKTASPMDDEDEERCDEGDRMSYFLVSDILALHGYWCGPMPAMERIKLAMQFTYTLNEGRSLVPGLNILAKEFFFQKDFVAFKDRFKSTEDGLMYFEHAATRIPFDTDILIAIRPELSYSQNAQEADRAVVKVNQPVKIDLQVIDTMRVAYGPKKEDFQNGTWSLKRQPPLKIQHEPTAVPIRTFVSLAAALPSSVKTSSSMPHAIGFVCLPFHDEEISASLSKQLLQLTRTKVTAMSHSHGRSLDAVHFVDTIGVCDCEFSAAKGQWKIKGFSAFQPIESQDMAMAEAHRRAMMVDSHEDVTQRILSLLLQKGVTMAAKNISARLCLVHHDTEKKVIRLGYRGLHPCLEKARQSRQVLSGLRKVESLPGKSILKPPKHVNFSSNNNNEDKSPPELTYEPIFGEQNQVPIGVGELLEGDQDLESDINKMIRTKRKAICPSVFDRDRGIWAIVDIRNDKEGPNFHSTVIGCLLSMLSDLTLDEIGLVLLEAKTKKTKKKKKKEKEKPQQQQHDDADASTKRKTLDDDHDGKRKQKKQKKMAVTASS